MSYTYNLDGSVASVTYPSGATITYTPDSAGRMISAVDKDNSINYVTGGKYNSTNALTDSIYGYSSGSFSGIINSFSYNNRLQPVTLWSTSPVRTLMYLVYDFHLGGGDNGNVWGIPNNRDTTRSQTLPTMRSTVFSRPRTPGPTARSSCQRVRPSSGATATVEFILSRVEGMPGATCWARPRRNARRKT